MNDFDRLMQEVRTEMKRLKIPVSPNIDPVVRVNRRAKTRFGMCIRVKDRFTIELSEVLLEAPERSCRQTLAHELIHTCRGCQNHGKTFIRYAEKMNRAYGYDIKRCHSPEEMGLTAESIAKKVNYIVRCTKCGTEIQRTRYSSVIADPSRYRCRCGGQLRRIK